MNDKNHPRRHRPALQALVHAMPDASSRGRIVAASVRCAVALSCISWAWRHALLRPVLQSQLSEATKTIAELQLRSSGKTNLAIFFGAASPSLLHTHTDAIVPNDTQYVR